ncbi:MAG: aldo/keto reductase [Spirochaetales bacterium]|jgi:aryl-alcohol dehydrogenase-like predicted oxidoreductase|nr:aldo/keto reductase [Spirochaetales bacterium]
MKIIPLGHSHLQISSLCLGAINFGTKLDEKASFAILDRYVEAGGNFIDTANNYSYWYNGKGGESETVLGNWMKDRGNREDVIIASKVGFNTPEIGHGLSESLIKSEFEGSLSRLRTEYIDLYYAHQDYRPVPLEEPLGTFHGLHRQGQIRAIGCSNYRAWRIEKARSMSREHGWPEYCCVQQRHTYLRPAPGASFGPQLTADDELLDYCRSSDDFVFLAYSPTLSGAYDRADREISGQYLGKDTDARLATLKRVADKHGATAIQIVLAWMLASDPFTVPLITAGTLKQLDDNLAAADIELTPEQMTLLNEAGNPGD